MAKSLIEGELIISVDFDGTMTDACEISEQPLTLAPHCERVLTRFYDDGFKLVLWTARAGSDLTPCIDFLTGNGLISLFDTVNEQLDMVKKKFFPNVGTKIGADVYLDDRNLGASYIKYDEVNKKTYVDWLEIEYLIYGERYEE